MSQKESWRKHPKAPCNQPFQLKGDQIKRSKKVNKGKNSTNHKGDDYDRV